LSNAAPARHHAQSGVISALPNGTVRQFWTSQLRSFWESPWGSALALFLALYAARRRTRASDEPGIPFFSALALAGWGALTVVPGAGPAHAAGLAQLSDRLQSDPRGLVISSGNFSCCRRPSQY